MPIEFKDATGRTHVLLATPLETFQSGELRDATLDDLATVIAGLASELHKDLVEKAQAEGARMSPEEKLRAGGPFELFSMLASQSRGLLRQSGVRNYLEIGFEDPLGRLTVTIQKAEGETPGNRAARFDQSRKDAVSAMRAAMALLDASHPKEATALLADALPKVEATPFAEMHPAAAEHLEEMLRRQKAADAAKDEGDT